MMTTSDGEVFEDPVASWLDHLDEAEEHPPLLQYDDGTWSVIDEDGWPSDPLALGVNLLEAAANPALHAAAIDVEAVSVTDTEVDE